MFIRTNYFELSRKTNKKLRLLNCYPAQEKEKQIRPETGCKVKFKHLTRKLNAAAVKLDSSTKFIFSCIAFSETKIFENSFTMRYRTV